MRAAACALSPSRPALNPGGPRLIRRSKYDAAMFKSAESRYALRAVLVGVASFLTALQAAGTDAWVNALIGGAVAALAYAGIGAASGSVEPFVGKKLDPPPEPPAGDA